MKNKICVKGHCPMIENLKSKEIKTRKRSVSLYNYRPCPSRSQVDWELYATKTIRKIPKDSTKITVT